MSALVTSAKALGGFAGRDGGAQMEPLAIAAALLIGAIAIFLVVRAYLYPRPRRARSHPPAAVANDTVIAPTIPWSGSGRESLDDARLARGDTRASHSDGAQRAVPMLDT